MLTSFCPVICTSRLEVSRAFYQRLFGFTATFTTRWYAGLARPGGRQQELALVDHTHPALPESLRRPVRAVRLTVEVDGGPEEWDRIAALGAAGRPERKHLVVTDPNGVRIDVVAPA
ncbi:glyoxalase [Streptomyces sp. NBC_01498]|uniref:VOC family protein n=1 Tax=Streptomyces sp. NBC_01498 TaxID=2975870 RepID=UPI002E7C51E7|nr:VOC family protein [Streptomyces sp. NBC_01498]WTL27976.1 glyoxalase [Streptomyces sp. NBC_01498]